MRRREPQAGADRPRRRRMAAAAVAATALLGVFALAWGTWQQPGLQRAAAALLSLCGAGL